MNLIIDLTDSCNIDCAYCYKGGSNIGKTMSIPTLENTIMKCAEHKQGSPIKFIWHGGEPLTAGLEIFQQIVNLQHKYYGIEIAPSAVNCVQTNLTLLNEEYADFFKLHKFNIGFSIDGPKILNDATRKYASGRGTFDQIKKNLELLRSRDHNVSAICVLTKNNIDHLDELYNFFRDNGIDVKFNNFFCDGSGIANKADLSVDAEKYGKALIKLFDLWYHDKEFRIRIEPLYETIGNVISGGNQLCTFKENCQDDFLHVSTSGEVCPCVKFMGFPDLSYGNINDNTIEEILNSPARQRLLSRRKEKLHQCYGSCEWLDLCNGGCPITSYMEGDLYGKDALCEAYRTVFQHIANEPSIKKARENYKK